MKSIIGVVRKYYSIWLIFLIILPYRLYNINQPLVNITNFRQAQTATFTLNFHREGINLFQTELDILGKGKEKYLLLEFPIYEAFVATLYNIFYVSDMWGRAVSVIFGYIGAWYLYRLLLLVLKNKHIALIASFFFLVVPINMVYHRDFLIESTVIGFLLGGMYYACKWIYFGNKKNLILALFMLSIGYMQKGMYGPFWLLPICWLYINRNNQKKSISLSKHVSFAAIVILPLLILSIWQNYVDTFNTMNGHPFFTSYDKGQREWNIGTLADRLSLSMWEIRLHHILNSIFLKPGIILFLIGLVFAKKIKYTGFLFIWLLSQACYFLILFRIQSHINYHMLFVPVASSFMSIGLIHLYLILSKLYNTYVHPTSHSVNVYGKALCIALIGMVFLMKSWQNSQWDASADLAWYRRLQEVGNSVPQRSYGIFVNPGYDWNSVYTYYPKLKMLLVDVGDVTSDTMKKWKSQGYTYIILHDYKAYKDYLTKINKPNHSIEFVRKYQQKLELEDYQVYLIP